jgi:cation diffusion facilitator CzcD-associated flavoprotein CzcO
VLFQPYPKNWPIFTPRDKLADWLEQYPMSQDLIVWTNTTLESSVRPTYDKTSKRWHLAVTRDGKEVILRPAHIIMATSTLGTPRSPIIRDESLFSGIIYHACEFQGGKAHEGQRVLVIGAGNTGADIAQDCVMQGAKEVYMVQRSSTCAISAEALAESTSVVFPEGQDLEVTDFKYQATPIGLQRQWAIEDREKREKRDEALFRKLTNKGVKLNQGRDGSGHFLLIYERWGGSLLFFSDINLWV